ncbi:NTF2-related export protein-like [Sitodiplosis mosellana]|uniref:NTF2-related export protein-like n=1 Tax=Sitodiplosis mosellana TaxID=263140 RepID=UPI002443F042|nr:NTF2-related export protein-like [Sitodiplosis mosellana]
MSAELRFELTESTKTAEEFIQLYYQSVDHKRHQISRLYMDNAIAAWNGNGINGKENIQEFFQGLPATEHTASVCDVQPIIDEATSNQKTLLILVSGSLRVLNNPLKQFQQTFVISAQDDKWKIVRDCFRIQDSLCPQFKRTAHFK